MPLTGELGSISSLRVCVYSCVCRFTWVCTHACLSMQPEARGQPWVSSCRTCPPCFETRVSTAWSLTSKVRWPATAPQGSSGLSIHWTGFTNACHHNWHYWCGFWGLNAVPHACTASSLPTEASLPFILPSWFIFKFCSQEYPNWVVGEDAGHQRIFWEEVLRP